MLKRLFHAISILAISHMLVFTGMLAFLFMSGRLNSERVNMIAGVLRGEELVPTDQQPTTQPAGEESVEPQPASAEKLVEKNLEGQEIRQQRFQRAHVDLLALRQRYDTLYLQLIQQKEELDRKIKMLDQQRKELRKEVTDEGFEKALATVRSMEPEQVKEYFMTLEPMVVVQYLKKMPSYQAGQILGEFTTDEEQVFAKEVLEHMRSQDPT